MTIHRHRVLPFLRAFEAVSRLGHVRSAAAELHLTPGAVSHQIRMLERVLGLGLFLRERRRLVLTPQGQEFRATVAGMLRDLDRGLDALLPGREAERPRMLTVSSPSGIGHVWLAPRLLEMTGQLGLDGFETRIGREMKDVDWRRVDLALVYDDPPWPGFYWEALPDLRLSPLCSPALAGSLPLRRPRDLVRHRLLHEDDGAEWQRWLSGARTDPPPRNAYFNRLSMAFNAALTGQGVAPVSDFLARKYIETGQLLRPFAITIPAAKRYHVVVAESRRDEPLLARALDLIIRPD